MAAAGKALHSTEHRGPVPELPGVTPRNFLRACLLLLLRERPDYGYDLIERLGALGVPHEDPGAVYRTLRGLERGGLVRSGWAQSSAGPARRTYELTPAGQEALETCGHALDQCRRIIEGFLDRFLDATGPVVATGNGSG